MTTTMDDKTPPGPPDPPPLPTGPTPPAPGVRRLRRSREDRIGAGLAGGLGRYFNIDPVIFRVLFAVLALFGGSGIALYLLGWLAVPDEGATNAPVDRVIAELRRRRVPFWLVVGGGLLLGWGLFFSWWAPHSLIPAVIVAVALVVLLARHRPSAPPASVPPASEPPAFGSEASELVPSARPDTWPTGSPPSSPAPERVPSRSIAPAASQLRSWFDESRVAARERRRRATPVRVSVLASVVVAVAVLAVVDAVSGIPFAAYFWAVGGIVLGGLVIGLLARRTAWSTTLLLVPVAVGLAVFASSPVRAHDGWGDRSARPADATELPAQYRLAFGRDSIDLRDLHPLSTARTVQVVHGAGQVRVIVPRSLPVRIDADVHAGAVELNGVQDHAGVNYNRTYSTPAAAGSTTVLRIHVAIAAGQLQITYV
ncbi:MAG: PspC domain-containing protein [Actinomycetota bacterium]|nr:PspC domain-containing protein [Actinomycetota bacterium]